MTYTFKLRRGPSTEWTTDNPILDEGEPGLETDTGKFKLGDGIQSWIDLPYYLPEPMVQELVDAAILASLESQTFMGTTTFSGRQITTPDVLTISAGLVAVDASLGNRFTLNATANFTLSNPTNGVAGQEINIAIKQDAVGSRAITLGSNYRLGVDVDTVFLSLAVNRIDYLGLVCRDGTLWDVVSFVRGFV